MSFDHGLLNLPLARRGDIDAGLYRYKREQAAAAKARQKAAAAEHKALKAQAKVALAELDACAGLLEAKAAKLGVTRQAVYAALLDWSKWQPARVLKAKAEWMAGTEPGAE